MQAAASADPGPFAATPGHADHDLPRRYLGLVGGVAERLLAAHDPAAMVDELFALIRDELQLDVFFNYRRSGDRLVLEASGGLTEAEAAAAATLALGEAVCGCVARDAQPRHMVAVQASDEPLAAFVRGMGIDAYVCTPLLHGDEVIGTLGFGRRWTDRFSDDELRFIHNICHYAALAKYRLRTEAALRESVRQREQLLAELNHRVRNALQVAVGLVAMEVGTAPDPIVRAALERTLDRLQVVAVAHRPLYAGGPADRIDLEPLLAGIAEREVATGAIAVVGTHQLPIEQAVALALLVRALLSQRARELAPTVRVQSDGDHGDRRLSIVFTGPQWGKRMIAAGEERMITALSRQLRATLSFDGDAQLLVSMPYAPRG